MRTRSRSGLAAAARRAPQYAAQVPASRQGPPAAEIRLLKIAAKRQKASAVEQQYSIAGSAVEIMLMSDIDK